jgi:DNA-binding SARP family transcriptional activator
MNVPLRSIRYAEEIYRRLIDLYEKVGRLESAKRLYRILEARPEELEVEPDLRSVAVIERVRRSASRAPSSDVST